MIILKLAAAAASKPVVTNTATSVLDLITTAGSAAHGIPGYANAIDIVPEDGDVRVLMDGNTPTATNGLLLKQGITYSFRNIPLTKMKLIRVSGNVNCSVQVGFAAPEETTVMGGSATNVSVTSDTELPTASVMVDNDANPTTSRIGANMLLWDGATWDRAPGNSTDGMLVNLGANNDVTIASLPALAAGSAIVGKVGIDQTTPGTTNGVQVNAALPAGSAVIGKVGIDQTTPGTTNAVAPISGQDGVAGGAGAVGATVQRMTLASDDPAVTSLQIMDDWDESDRAKVNPIVGQAGVAAGSGASGVTTQRVIAATDSPEVTSLQLIDDAVFTDDTAFTPATSKGIAVGMQADETSADSVDEGDFGVPRMTLDRRQRVANRSVEGPGEPGTAVDSYTHAAISAAVTTANQSLVAAPGASKQIWVYGINFVTAAAGTVSFQDEDDTAISGVMSFAANGGMAVAPSGNFSMPLWKLPTNKALEVDTASGADAKGWISYAIVSV